MFTFLIFSASCALIVFGALQPIESAWILAIPLGMFGLFAATPIAAAFAFSRWRARSWLEQAEQIADWQVRHRATGEADDDPVARAELERRTRLDIGQRRYRFGKRRLR